MSTPMPAGTAGLSGGRLLAIGMGKWGDRSGHSKSSQLIPSLRAAGSPRRHCTIRGAAPAHLCLFLRALLYASPPLNLGTLTLYDVYHGRCACFLMAEYVRQARLAQYFRQGGSS